MPSDAGVRFVVVGGVADQMAMTRTISASPWKSTLLTTDARLAGAPRDRLGS